MHYETGGTLQPPCECHVMSLLISPTRCSPYQRLSNFRRIPIRACHVCLLPPRVLVSLFLAFNDQMPFQQIYILRSLPFMRAQLRYSRKEKLFSSFKVSLSALIINREIQFCIKSQRFIPEVGARNACTLISLVSGQVTMITMI